MPEGSRNLYLVWRGYQRRAEVLAPYLDAELILLPNRWSSRGMRPLDYFLNFLATARILLHRRPRFLVFQSPPPYPALVALSLRVPYVIDAHNASIQGWWARAPLARIIAARSRAVVTHNDEAAAMAREIFPESRVLTLRDPLGQMIHAEGAQPRDSSLVLMVCSFAADEPIELIHNLVAARPDLRFVITAPVERLTPSWADALARLSNLKLTGFLPTKSYHELLRTCGVAVVLTTRQATQPSGACEALSADTPLVASKTSIISRMFGSWARLAVHEVSDLSGAIDEARQSGINLAGERAAWMRLFKSELRVVRSSLGLGDGGQAA